jgi:ribonuclease M5
MLKEIIVVEGRDDITAVKRAVDAEVIAVGGFGINAKVINKIREAQKRQGVIVLTDPDFAGEKIRSIIKKRIPDVKHAYISREEGTKDGDIGVENAAPKAIIEALEKAHCVLKDRQEDEFDIEDMVFFKLVGDKDSKARRQSLGSILKIGYGNGNQFLSRLNSFGITKEEFIHAIKKMEKEMEKENGN